MKAEENRDDISLLYIVTNNDIRKHGITLGNSWWII